MSAATSSDGKSIQLRGVNMHFGGLHAINELTVDIEPGRTTALIGPNGAGKTTIFNIITGFLKPQSGHVSYGDRSLDGARPDQVVAAGIGRSFQDLKLFRGLTSFENVLAATPAPHGSGVFGAVFAPRAIRRELVDRTAVAEEMLRFTGLIDKRHVPARDLGYAEAKMLALARVLTLKPDFLLLDEPCSGLDRTALDRIRELLHTLVQQGTSICLIEHNMALVRDVADVGVFLERGALIASDTIDNLLADKSMRERYLGIGA
jgi:ABC-type branched-subunit amino acid transport system ATPase component